jgi:hypothetical protein
MRHIPTRGRLPVRGIFLLELDSSRNNIAHLHFRSDILNVSKIDTPILNSEHFMDEGLVGPLVKKRSNGIIFAV